MSSLGDQLRALAVTADAWRPPSTEGPTPTPTPVPTPAPVSTGSPALYDLIEVPWDSRGARTYISAVDGRVTACGFTTGPEATDSRGAVNISVSIYGSAPSPMRAVLSRNPGDMDNPIGPVGFISEGPESLTITFDVASAAHAPYTPSVPANTRLYLNVTKQGGGAIQAYVAKPGYL